MADFGVAHIDEIEELDDGRQPFRSVRLHFGIETFGATTWTARADGDQLINEHDETDPTSGDELYYVARGHARFVLDGAEHDAPEGSFVFARPGVKRVAFARQAGTTVLAVGAGAPGMAYKSHNWETWAPLIGLFREQRYEEFLDRARGLLADDRSGAGCSNVACAESLLGRVDDALADLRSGLELDPQLVELARSDSDLDAIRDRPEFAEILSSVA